MWSTLNNMSILYRTKEWLTVAQLARAGAAEIAGAERDTCGQELVHLQLEDFFNGRLDDAGPPVEG